MASAVSVRIQGVPIDRDPNKHIVIALTGVYGIGRSTSKKILSAIGISETTRIKELTDDQVKALQAECDKYELEGDIRRKVKNAIKRLTDLKTYRGLRHKNRLPARGQRTRTNARTRKGPRGKQVGSKK